MLQLSPAGLAALCALAFVGHVAQNLAGSPFRSQPNIGRAIYNFGVLGLLGVSLHRHCLVADCLSLRQRDGPSRAHARSDARRRERKFSQAETKNACFAPIFCYYSSRNRNEQSGKSHAT
jgi:hypothetical protein